MSYLGNTPDQQAFTPAIDYFSGNGSTVAFTLSRPVASVAQVQVVIENVPQNPSTAFTVSGNTITFTSAPPSGSNNIYVEYTSPITQVIQPGQGTVNTVQLVDAGVTLAKLDSNVTSFLVPSGIVGFFARSSAPTGWLKANGANVSRTTYATLFAAIGTTFGTGDGSTTFTLPDMRGYFPRGWADNGSVDSGRTFGSTQADAMQGHKHTQSLGGSISTVNNVAGSYVIGNSNTSVVSDPISDGVNGTPRTASETRPSNVALLACIKY